MQSTAKKPPQEVITTGFLSFGSRCGFRVFHMTHHIDLSLQKPLEDYISLLEKLSMRSLGLMADMTAYDVFFIDPVHEVRGASALAVVWTRRFEAVHDWRCRVTDFAWMRRERTATISWDVGGRIKKRPLIRSGHTDFAMSGTTEITFNQEGKISFLREFWGKASGDFGKAYKQPIEGLL